MRCSFIRTHRGRRHWSILVSTLGAAECWIFQRLADRGSVTVLTQSIASYQNRWWRLASANNRLCTERPPRGTHEPLCRERPPWRSGSAKRRSHVNSPNGTAFAAATRSHHIDALRRVADLL